jgi:hypothetical protein
VPPIDPRVWAEYEQARARHPHTYWRTIASTHGRDYHDWNNDHYVGNSLNVTYATNSTTTGRVYYNYPLNTTTGTASTVTITNCYIAPAMWNTDYAAEQVAEDQLPDEMLQESYRLRREERRQLREAREQTQRDAHARQGAARARARETLRALLGEERWAVWEETRQVFVTGQSGREYVVTAGHIENVHLLDGEGRVEATYCAHPPTSVYDEDGHFLGELPGEDVLIAQILLLTADEDRFLRVANRNTRYRGTEYRRPAAIAAA